MNTSSLVNKLTIWSNLLRWNKPSGRLILLIPAGWSLWLTPNAPPQTALTVLIFLGGISVSGAGCIANDLWDRHIDRKVKRTRQRPLAKGSISTRTALTLLVVMLAFSLFAVSQIPLENRSLCLGLALIALPIILIYPSAKRWFLFPQAILALCWGFAVLIPWAASQGDLNGGWPLFACWSATLIWTFGFDTVYAMADIDDDKRMGLQSSAITLGKNGLRAVSLSYGLTSFLLATASFTAEVGWCFWPCWIVASMGMQRETFALRGAKPGSPDYGKHFQHQVLLGSSLMFGLIASRLS